MDHKQPLNCQVHYPISEMSTTNGSSAATKSLIRSIVKAADSATHPRAAAYADTRPRAAGDPAKPRQMTDKFLTPSTEALLRAAIAESVDDSRPRLNRRLRQRMKHSVMGQYRASSRIAKTVAAATAAVGTLNINDSQPINSHPNSSASGSEFSDEDDEDVANIDSDDDDLAYGVAHSDDDAVFRDTDDSDDSEDEEAAMNAEPNTTTPATDNESDDSDSDDDDSDDDAEDAEDAETAVIEKMVIGDTVAVSPPSTEPQMYEVEVDRCVQI